LYKSPSVSRLVNCRKLRWINYVARMEKTRNACRILFVTCYCTVGRHEIKVVTSASYLRGLYLSTMVFSERTSLFITLLSYSLMGHHISADKVFDAYSLLEYYVKIWKLTLTFDHFVWRWWMPCLTDRWKIRQIYHRFKFIRIPVAANKMHTFEKICTCKMLVEPFP
jgi:hypothetical protein